ncbi:hypothetical protein [Rhodopirellula sp. P2]|uniref:hypothetical protein n=1 Tax=Rhodopirellula sp. P2 TaxID=2127060 RepID=UPI0023675E17|nr:hypothetical protein [Rhodopirellula sp. P2]WDQ18708.1 hypothetical protein PSR62_09215 [Rhodopirellula sp. P2]
MSTALQLSLEEYDRMIAAGAFVGMDRHIELIRGELRQMNPAGPVHWDLIAYVMTWSAEQAASGRPTLPRLRRGRVKFVSPCDFTGSKLHDLRIGRRASS